MKHPFHILMTLALLPVLTASTAATDSQDHRLVKLWQQYEKAEAADLPKTQADVLDQIKKEALRQRFTWDYYDACDRYQTVRARSNWKLRDSLRTAFRAEIESYGDPAAIYYMRRGEEGLEQFVLENEKSLRKGSNPEFWKRDWKLNNYRFSSPLMNYIKNDWDWCLWSLFPKDRMASEYTEYPLSAFVEWQNLPGEDRNAALEAFAKKYDGKAVALFAREDILRNRFGALSEGGTSEDYKALRRDCEAAMAEAKSCKGAEKEIAECCDMAASLIAQMDSESLSISIEDSRMTITVRNLDKVTVKVLKDKKKVWESEEMNPARSYYAPDEIKAVLPQLPDGTYSVECSSGDIADSVDWEKYTVSAASRWNGDGLGVWAADFRSGEPLAVVDVEALNGDKVLKTVKGLRLDGFTTLPEDFSALFSKSARTLRIRSGERASRTMYPGSYTSPDLSDNPGLRHCTVLTDRSAFQPGETVHFKAVLYSGKYSLKPWSGAKVKVLLRDVQGAVIEEKSFTANELGSIAGEFVLQRRERNGNYCIVVMDGSNALAHKYIKVDDFVLPTFDLVFDSQPQLYFPVKEITLKGTVKAYSGHSLAGGDISWRVSHNGRDWASGKLEPEKDRFSFSFPADTTENNRWGSSYAVSVKVTDVTGETMEFQKWISVYGKPESRIQLDHFFEELEGEEAVGARVVAGVKETWMVAELYGTGNKLLDRKMVHFFPVGGEFAGTTVSWPFLESYPEAVRACFVYFQDKSVWSHTADKRRRDTTYDMPLSFGRFLDTTVPGAQYTFEVRTGAGAEVAATVFDKSTERFMANTWSTVRPYDRPGPSVWFSATPGTDGGRRRIFYTTSANRGMVLMSKAAMADSIEAVEEEAVMDMAAPAAMEADGGAPEDLAADIPIREDFATTIAWEPFLKADSDGKVKFTFTNADKLSTFYVQLFSHDAQMRNATLRRGMVVTIPVKISLVEPQFLYEGDRWNMRIGLASGLGEDASGTLAVSFMDGPDYRTAKVLSSVALTVTVPSGGSCSVDVPFTAPAGLQTLGVKLTFVPDGILNGSDGVFVTVPVAPAVQTLSEAHSAVLLSGMDRTALEKELRAAFVNIPGSAASLREIAIIDMIREALPEAIEPRCDNAIALSSALYAAALCDSLGVSPDFDRDGATRKLLALRGSDGGFAWLPGMQSSAIVTAVVLQRLHGLGIVDEEAAVHFLDKSYFGRDEKRWWFCGISMEQYLYTRSLFPEVSFGEKTTGDFRKAAREYLVPRKARGLNGQVFAKSRRLLTLDNLSELEGGTALARRMGVKLLAAKKLRKSIEADVESLSQYSEAHRHGGVYYPNAVMPWRGLMESELYAHSSICRLMDKHGHGDIANGIRLWIMLQKETQHWEGDPGYIEAIAAVMDAPRSVLDTRVLALSGFYTKPFSEIVATGNGVGIKQMAMAYTVPAAWRRGSGSDAGAAADSLKVGDRIRITWEVSSEENRSFVKVTLPHTAGLVPVNQVSGYNWSCYRSVLADRTELWYEAYPEEKITVSEEYYVTRAGAFQCPAARVECLYATHYQANTSAPEIQIIQ